MAESDAKAKSAITDAKAGGDGGNGPPSKAAPVSPASLPVAPVPTLPFPDFVAKCCPLVQKFVAEQQFSEWGHVAWCATKTDTQEASEVFATVAKAPPASRAFAEYR